MMPDIFSTFDPFMSSTLIPIKSCFLVLLPFALVALKSSLFPSSYRWHSSSHITTEIMFSLMQRTFSSSLKGLSLTMTTLFPFIVLINLVGMIPYSFSLSSHLIMTLSFGLPLWLSLITSSFLFNPKKAIAHFLPDGAPDWLNPFLVLIETTSIMVRPLTLSFRLAANMTAGHIVLTLLSIYLSTSLFSSWGVALTLLFSLSFYIVFELAICLIQAYIFCLLISLYSDDHSS